MALRDSRKNSRGPSPVIPAQAGIQTLGKRHWIPAREGMTRGMALSEWEFLGSLRERSLHKNSRGLFAAHAKARGCAIRLRPGGARRRRAPEGNSVTTVFGQGAIDFRQVFDNLHAADFYGPFGLDLETIHSHDVRERHKELLALIEYLQDTRHPPPGT